MDAVQEGESWLAAEAGATIEEIKEKHQEIEQICAPIISKHYQGSSKGTSKEEEEEEGNDYDEL